MNRGDVYWVNLEPGTPPEFGKTRPAIIVSNSDQNELLQTVVVVPLSSKEPAIWPLRISVTLPKKESFAVIPGIRQVSKSRLTSRIGQVSSLSMKEIDRAVHEYLSD